MRRMGELLSHPYESEIPPITIEMPEKRLVFIDRGYPWTGFVLARYPEGWERVPENAKIPF